MRTSLARRDARYATKLQATLAFILCRDLISQAGLLEKCKAMILFKGGCFLVTYLLPEEGPSFGTIITVSVLTMALAGANIDSRNPTMIELMLVRDTIINSK